ncbi:cation:proton antiporter [Nocardiopsis lucentensis]|uniref:cation:proton antiporter n=1 Tax=Nocardiopsis lucentensis TaxID=53441 RepID=UPI000349DAD7|nr:cation:proton antiporter [Nocardiopsis lucentensis]
MTDVIAFAVLLLGYALISGRTQGTSLTAPMVFTTGGLVLGAGGLDLLGGSATGATVRVLTEVALTLVLFTDAVRIDLRVLRREYHLPLLLLGIGMPVGIALGTAAAQGILPGLSLAGAALLASVLAPTDAALGQAVISDRRLPVRIRQTLNVESGLNDGIALPAVMVFSALAASEEVGGSTWSWAGFAAGQIGVGALVGVCVGGLGAWAITRADAAGWVNATHRRLFAIGVAGLSYAGAEVTTGSGFLAAFVAGLVFGALARQQREFVHQFAEREGELLTLMTFALFGAVIIGPRLGDVDGLTLVYAVLSLAVVRPLAVAVATLGARLRPETVCFLGWFGPRGLASIVFALLVVEHGDVAEADRILLVAGVTVLLSVYAHGITAAPWARSFGRRAGRYDPTAPEHRDVTVHHHRWHAPRGQDTGRGD